MLIRLRATAVAPCYQVTLLNLIKRELYTMVNKTHCYKKNLDIYIKLFTKQLYNVITCILNNAPADVKALANIIDCCQCTLSTK